MPAVCSSGPQQKTPAPKGTGVTRDTTLLPAADAPGVLTHPRTPGPPLRTLVGVQPYPRCANGQRCRLGLLVALSGHVRRAAQEGLLFGRSTRSHRLGLASLQGTKILVSVGAMAESVTPSGSTDKAPTSPSGAPPPDFDRYTTGTRSERHRRRLRSTTSQEVHWIESRTRRDG